MKDLLATRTQDIEHPTSAPGDGVVSLRDLLLLFRRRRWLIGTGTVVGTLATLALALTAEPQYSAQSSVVIDPRPTAVGGMRPATETLRIDPVSLMTQVDVLRSRELVYQVVEDLELYQDPALSEVRRGKRFTRWLPAGMADRLAEQASGWLDRAWDLVSRGLASTGLASSLPSIGRLDVLPERLVSRPEEPHSRVVERTVDEFVKRYEVRRQDDSQVISLRFTHPDPRVATNIVNRAADLYVERLLSAKVEQAARIAEWVRGRFLELEGVVRASEEKLENFRADEGLIEVVSERADIDHVNRLREERARAEASLSVLRSRLAIIDRHMRNDDLDSILGVISSPILDRLRQEDLDLAGRELELSSLYGPRHPQIQVLGLEQERVRERISQEIGRLRFDMGSELSILQKRLEAIDSEIAEFESDLGRRQRSQAQLRELEREASSNREFGELFRDYYKSVSEQRAIIESDARVLAYGKPPSQPSSLSPKILSLIGLVAAFTGSTLFALTLDGIDRRVRSARQIERKFKIRVLEAVPQINGRAVGRKVVEYIHRRPRAAYPEAIRSAYTTLRLLTTQSDGPLTLVVCSAISGEGKTSVSLSLAAVAALWGQKTIIVDLDLRHPSVAGAIGEKPSKGVLEVIHGRMPLEDAIYRTSFGFDVLPVAETPRDTAGLIGDPRTRQLISRLREHYDLVLIDTAPLLAVSDGRLAAQLGDSVVLVTRWLFTPLAAVRRALQMLRDCHADTAGIVLYRVSSNRYMYYENEDGSNYYKNIKKYYRN